MTTVDNGVNVQALLDAREVLAGAPEAAQFTWRATSSGRTACTARRRSRTSSVSARSRATRPRPCSTPTTPRSSPPQDKGDHADRVPPRRPGELPDRRRRRRSRRTAASSCARSRRPSRATTTSAGILGVDSDVRNGFNDIKVTFTIDADASQEEIEALVAQSQKRSAVFDALDEPDRGHRRGRLTGSRHRALHHRRHRRRPRRPRRQPLPQRAVDRPRRARARRGGELLAARALGLAAAAHAQLAEPPSRLSLRRADPDGYMTSAEVVDFIERYAAHARAPVRTRHERDLGPPAQTTATGSRQAKASSAPAPS